MASMNKMNMNVNNIGHFSLNTNNNKMLNINVYKNNKYPGNKIISNLNTNNNTRFFKDLGNSMNSKLNYAESRNSFSQDNINNNPYDYEEDIPESQRSENVTESVKEERGTLDNIDLLETIYKTQSRANFLKVINDKASRNKGDTVMSNSRSVSENRSENISPARSRPEQVGRDNTEEDAINMQHSAMSFKQYTNNNNGEHNFGNLNEISNINKNNSNLNISNSLMNNSTVNFQVAGITNTNNGYTNTINKKKVSSFSKSKFNSGRRNFSSNSNSNTNTNNNNPNNFNNCITNNTNAVSYKTTNLYTNTNQTNINTNNNQNKSVNLYYNSFINNPNQSNTLNTQNNTFNLINNQNFECEMCEELKKELIKLRKEKMELKFEVNKAKKELKSKAEENANLAKMIMDKEKQSEKDREFIFKQEKEILRLGRILEGKANLSLIQMQNNSSNMGNAQITKSIDNDPYGIKIENHIKTLNDTNATEKTHILPAMNIENKLEEFSNNKSSNRNPAIRFEENKVVTENEKDNNYESRREVIGIGVVNIGITNENETENVEIKEDEINEFFRING